MNVLLMHRTSWMNLQRIILSGGKKILLKRKGHRLYDCTYIAFLKWQNCRNGEQLRYCQGLSKWWSGREAGVILKEVQPMILVGLELFHISTSSMSISWFCYWAIVFHDVTIGEIGWGYTGSPCIISWNCNLQFSQNWKYN